MAKKRASPKGCARDRARRAMPWRHKVARLGLAALALGGLTGATGMDPVNPTCPLNLDWSNNPTMKLTVEKRAGMKVMLAEGRWEGRRVGKEWVSTWRSRGWPAP